MKIARESWIIAAIGIADLITTILFIRHHGAEEANPLFRHFWEMGLPAFILAKLACVVGPLCILEWARQRRGQFVTLASRSVIAAYLVLYCLGVSQLNGPQAQANEVRRTSVAMAGNFAMPPYPLYGGRISPETWRYRMFRMRQMGRMADPPIGAPRLPARVTLSRGE
jgi:hypothetical protein